MRASSERGTRPTSTADSSRSAQEERKKARGGEGERVWAQSLICVPAFLCVAVLFRLHGAPPAPAHIPFPLSLALYGHAHNHTFQPLFFWPQFGYREGINLRNIVENLLVCVMMPQNNKFMCIFISTACTTYLH